MDFDAIIILGPQGSGKSTQGKRLAEKLGFFFWDTGEVLRDIYKKGGPLAEKLAPGMEHGVLLSDEIIIEVLQERLPALSPTQGVIFDGVPRRLGQGQFLLEFLKGQKRKRPVTVFVDVPREVSHERLLRRASIEKRADDTPEAIAERLRAYDETMRPVMEYLRAETTFITIDGRPSVEEIEKNIDAALGLART